jgi:hypothetical protein
MLLLLVGLALLVFGSLFGFTTYRRVRTWTHTPGRVVEVVTEIGDEGGAITLPLVEYTTSDGQVMRARPYEARGTRLSASYQVGDRVEVIYNPANPGDMFLNDFTHVWFLPALTLGLGLLASVIGGGWSAAVLAGAPRRWSH